MIHVDLTAPVFIHLFQVFVGDKYFHYDSLLPHTWFLWLSTLSSCLQHLRTNSTLVFPDDSNCWAFLLCGFISSALLRDDISAGTDVPVAALNPAHSFPLLHLPHPFNRPHSSVISSAWDDVPVGALDLACSLLLQLFRLPFALACSSAAEPSSSSPTGSCTSPASFNQWWKRTHPLGEITVLLEWIPKMRLHPSSACDLDHWETQNNLEDVALQSCCDQGMGGI